MTPEQCKEHVMNTIIKANDVFKLNLDLPEVDFFNTTSRLGGTANIKSYKVTFNKELMTRNSSEYINTIIHEVSHLVAYKVFPRMKQAHGPEFKEVMRLLGGTPNRCHNYNTTGLGKAVKRHLYRCSHCDAKYKVTTTLHRKMQVSDNYSCKDCSCKVFTYYGYVIV